MRSRTWGAVGTGGENPLVTRLCAIVTLPLILLLLFVVVVQKLVAHIAFWVDWLFLGGNLMRLIFRK